MIYVNFTAINLWILNEFHVITCFINQNEIFSPITLHALIIYSCVLVCCLQLFRTIITLVACILSAGIQQALSYNRVVQQWWAFENQMCCAKGLSSSYYDEKQFDFSGFMLNRGGLKALKASAWCGGNALESCVDDRRLSHERRRSGRLSVVGCWFLAWSGCWKIVMTSKLIKGWMHVLWIRV